MIVYRCLTSDEILSYINDNKYDIPLIDGKNTFKYDINKSYKHFFLYADHAEYFKNRYKLHYPCIGQYVIPDELIEDNGFGFYGYLKSSKSDKLFNYYSPIPEIIIDQDNFDKKFLYKVQSENYGGFITKKLDGYDNKRLNEEEEELFSVNNMIHGYYDYSYADVYYELVYKLAKENNMDMEKVCEILKDKDLSVEINNFFNENTSLFEEETKKLIKQKY